MTFFRADNDDCPQVVEALNARLEGTFPRGPTVNYAAVTLEEAQLAVGCGEPTVECWNALAEPIPTTALMVAEVNREGQKGIRIALRLYDALGQKMLRFAERAYGTQEEAMDGIPEVVDAFVLPHGGTE